MSVDTCPNCGCPLEGEAWYDNLQRELADLKGSVEKWNQWALREYLDPELVNARAVRDDTLDDRHFDTSPRTGEIK